MPLNIGLDCRFLRRPICDLTDLLECLRNPGSDACKRARDCHRGWLEVRWLCRILPQLVPPIPLPRPDPPPFSGLVEGDPDPWMIDPHPWPIKPRFELMRNAFDADLELDLLAPSRFHRDESALPSAVAFIRKERLVPEAARNLAKRLRETSDLLEKEAELMEKHAG